MEKLLNKSLRITRLLIIIVAISSYYIPSCVYAAPAVSDNMLVLQVQTLLSQTSVPEKSAVVTAWKKLLKTGRISSGSIGLQHYNAVIELKNIIESSIAVRADIDSVAVIACSINGPVQELLVKKPVNNVIRQLLASKATIISLYSSEVPKFKIRGYRDYITLLKSNRNLLDKQTKNIPHKHCGTTYIIRQGDNKMTVFSVSYVHEEEIAKGGKFDIWFGDIKNRNVSRRMVGVDSFLKSRDIDIYQYINDGKTIDAHNSSNRN